MILNCWTSNNLDFCANDWDCCVGQIISDVDVEIIKIRIKPPRRLKVHYLGA